MFVVITEQEETEVRPEGKQRHIKQKLLVLKNTDYNSTSSPTYIISASYTQGVSLHDFVSYHKILLIALSQLQ